LKRAAVTSAILLCFVASACGTTVSLKDQALAGNQANQPGLGGNAGLGPSAPGSTPVGNGQLPPGIAPGTAVPSDVGSFAPGTSGSLRVPGVTATTIYVGATYQTDQGAVNSAIFGTALNGGDARNFYKVVIDDINKHGGIAGRRIVPVYFELHTADTTTIEQQYEAACSTWTKDNKQGVFAILDTGRPALRECARKNGVVEFGESSASVAQTFRQYPNYVELNGINMVREAPVTINGLAAQQYFDPGSKIGIVAWDDPNHREGVRAGYIPTLRSRGLSLATEPAFVHVPENAQDLGSSSAGVSAAVLRFNSLHVDHVFVLDGTAGICGGACLTTLFMREADSQNYHPRYGLNTNNQPQAGIDGNLYPTSQLSRSLAVLWGDQETAADVGIQKNAARVRCSALMKKNGYDIDGANSNFRGFALFACGEVWFMQAAAAKMTGPLTVANFMAGVNQLGDSHQDPTTYLAHYSSTQHDGAVGIRYAHYVDSCECFRYTSPVYRI
jgi:hypothetical protein